MSDPSEIPRVSYNEEGEWTYEGMTVDEQIQRALSNIAIQSERIMDEQANQDIQD